MKLNESTYIPGYDAPVPDNSFPHSSSNSDGSNNPLDGANPWENPDNYFGGDNKRRKRRNSDNPLDDFDDMFGNLPTDLPKIPRSGQIFSNDNDAAEDGYRQVIYPGEITLKLDR